MSINKFALSVALAGILGASSALAETSGAFVGVQAGYGGHKFTFDEVDVATGESFPFFNETATGFRYGVLGGYKQFFTPEFGARYYAVVDFGNFKKDVTLVGEDGTQEFQVKIKTWNITANADALYNFISSESLDFGVFAGLSLGYINSDFGDMEAKPSGFDLGINFGLRTNIAQNHGVKLYSRFGVLKQKEDIDRVDIRHEFKSQQPYTVGLRYSFSF